MPSAPTAAQIEEKLEYRVERSTDRVSCTEKGCEELCLVDRSLPSFHSAIQYLKTHPSTGSLTPEQAFGGVSQQKHKHPPTSPQTAPQPAPPSIYNLYGLFGGRSSATTPPPTTQQQDAPSAPPPSYDEAISQREHHHHHSDYLIQQQQQQQTQFPKPTTTYHHLLLPAKYIPTNLFKEHNSVTELDANTSLTIVTTPEAMKQVVDRPRFIGVKKVEHVIHLDQDVHVIAAFTYDGTTLHPQEVVDTTDLNRVERYPPHVSTHHKAYVVAQLSESSQWYSTMGNFCYVCAGASGLLGLYRLIVRK